MIYRAFELRSQKYVSMTTFPVDIMQNKRDIVIWSQI